MRFLKLLAIVVLFSACKNEESKFVVDANYTTEIDAFFESYGDAVIPVSSEFAFVNINNSDKSLTEAVRGRPSLSNV